MCCFGILSGVVGTWKPADAGRGLLWTPLSAYRNSAAINPLPGVWSTRQDGLLSQERRREVNTMPRQPFSQTITPPIYFSKDHQFISVQSLSCVRIFATPWTTACQASLSITNSRSPPKPMSIELVMPSNRLIFHRPLSSCPQSFPASGSFQMSQIFASGGQSIGVSASTSVLPMNTQDCHQSVLKIIYSPLRVLPGFPGDSVVKNIPVSAGDRGLIPGPWRSPGGGNGNPLQHSCLENSMDRGAWWATVHGVAKESDMM